MVKRTIATVICKNEAFAARRVDKAEKDPNANASLLSFYEFGLRRGAGVLPLRGGLDSTLPCFNLIA